jgi:hypothetical protein
MSRPDVNPGATETQQMRVTAPVGVSFRQFLVILFTESDITTPLIVISPRAHSLLCHLYLGQRPATSTSILFDRWAAHPRSGGLFRISAGSDGIKMLIPLFTALSFLT